VIEHLPSKYEAMSSNPSTTKKIKIEKQSFFDGNGFDCITLGGLAKEKWQIHIFVNDMIKYIKRV
jgi:hypothetical protein